MLHVLKDLLNFSYKRKDGLSNLFFVFDKFMKEKHFNKYFMR